METEEHSEASVGQIREIIRNFISDDIRSDSEESSNHQKNNTNHQPQLSEQENGWIETVSLKAEGIQKVTHVLKFTNPDANGTDLRTEGNGSISLHMVGTHTLGETYILDTTARVNPKTGKANNAAIPKNVCSFMDLDINGETLLSLARRDDPKLKAALSNDAEQAAVWMKSFASTTESKGEPSSHTLSKQIYWPLEEGGYNLLAPLFPTSLVNHVFNTILNDRFSDDAKAAREARKKEVHHACGYCEYPHVVVQKFGGTKPQNVSKLNSARHGENHLLPSLPPQWNSDPIKPPLRVESVFDGWFGRRRRVRDLVQTLSGFLYSVQGVDSNMHIRNKRIELVGYLVDEVLLFAVELQELDEPWTLHPDCKLNINEQYWLNPMRTQTDPEFSSAYAWGDWKENVCKRFGSWLNARLSDPKKPLPLGEIEAHEWRVSLEEGLDMNWQEVEYYE